jgi:hypothetical protein
MAQQHSFYRKTLNPTFLQAIGMAVVAWGDFEKRMDDCLRTLRAHPDAHKLGWLIPRQYDSRAKLFMDLCGLSFSSSPSLVAKIQSIMSTATRFVKQRDRLVHGMWMWFYPEKEAMIWIYEDEHRIYDATVEEIHQYAEDCMDLTARLLDIFVLGALEDHDYLTSDEKSALRDFHKSIEAHHIPTSVKVQNRRPSFRA